MDCLCAPADTGQREREHLDLPICTSLRPCHFDSSQPRIGVGEDRVAGAIRVIVVTDGDLRVLAYCVRCRAVEERLHLGQIRASDDVGLHIEGECPRF